MAASSAIRYLGAEDWKVGSNTERHLEKPLTPGETMKLIYRSMASTYSRIINQLEEITGNKINSILVVGGGNQAKILNQYTADVCGIDVITGSSEATVMGNSLSQFIALKEIKDVQEGRRDIASSISTNVYHPTNK